MFIFIKALTSFIGVTAAPYQVMSVGVGANDKAVLPPFVVVNQSFGLFRLQCFPFAKEQS
ncbi:hypothetical protein J6590_093768 [Homalodisca vitripennis]|nr:hypothetical protein J6590_093768 [Homalodisca vitripennis]